MVDLSALASVSEDPYEEELRRITVGLKTKEEIIGFLEQLNREWVNIGKKKKKVVKACDFGRYLPRGWRLLICIKKKGSNVWLACHRYIRYKVLEMVMKKLLNQTDTAEFVVAFAGIQDAIHQFGEQKKLRKLYPAVPSPLKGSGSSS